MKSDFMPYGRQYIDNKDIDEIVKILKSDWLTQGPKIEEFEKKIAKYCNAKYAVAVSSGTAALHAAYFAANIGSGDEVIISSLNFAAASNIIAILGGKPVFVDIQKDTLNMEFKNLERKITKKTKAIIPVDFAGHPCDLDEIMRIAKKHNLLVIEDAAHSLGSEYKGRRVGGIADMTVFSFHPVKLITTGEGGMVLTNNKKFYEKLKTFRHHGIVKKPNKGGWCYEIKEPGLNMRITDFQCALGLSQFNKMEEFIKRRREIISKYNEAFKSIDEIIIPTEKEYIKSSYHIYVIKLNLKNVETKRKKIFKELQKRHIGVQVHYIPLHLQPFYKKSFGYKKGDFPVAEDYYKRAITIPLFSTMTDIQVRRVIKNIKEIISKNKK